MSLDVHIVSHTHWDREWYHSFVRFRQRLASLVDELLDDPPGPDESFLLDGQAIVVDDYLALRPERTAELAELIRAGRIEAGPWYVLADELIPSGEALVRNLLAGRRVLARLRATSPPVLYCPDSFGHPAALPSLAAGFGLPLIIAWRGYGGARWPSGDVVRWLAPNGDAALLFHLPHDGYEFGSNLPTDDASAVQRWHSMRGELEPRATLGVTLVPNGADHHARQSEWRAAITALERAGRSDGVHRSSLTRFENAVVERASSNPLADVHGELRDSYGYTWTLQGTLATRAHEKRLDARAERLLLRDAEPWAALAAHGGASRRALVYAAWRSVLQAHPHDTLCGCSIDEVAAAMELRLHDATVQGQGIRNDSISDLLGHDPARARTARDQWHPIVVVRNASPHPRSGVALVDVDEFVADVRVGPSSAPTAPREIVLSRRKPQVAGLAPLQVLSRQLVHSRTESPRHYPDDDLVARHRVAAWVDDAPAYGLAAYSIGGRAAKRGGPREPVVVSRREMRNSKLIVSLDDDGSTAISDRSGARRITRVLELIDEADLGDLYTPSPRTRAYRVEARGARRVHAGPLRGELSVRYRIVDAASRRVDVDLTVHLTLDADAPFVRIRVAGVNRRPNHRTRLAFRTDLDGAAARTWADAAFGPVERRPLTVPSADALAEHPPPTAPLHRYISRFDATRGATVFSDGLAEYESRDDGAIVVTLLRAVGELSRNDIPERPGHAGWPTSTPLAQCLGPFEAEFALMLHGPRDPATIDAVERAADDVLLPLRGTSLRSALERPRPIAGIELIGEGLAFSAAKESEDGGALVLRCVNLLEQPLRGRWRLPFVVAEAWLATLDETQMRQLQPRGDMIEFEALPRDIVTVLVR